MFANLRICCATLLLIHTTETLLEMTFNLFKNTFFKSYSPYRYLKKKNALYIGDYGRQIWTTTKEQS